MKKINEKKSPLKEQIYLYIRDKIIKGELQGGEFIEEETITSIMGYSRTPVREAFLKLEAEKFIELLPRKGARVRQITGQEIINIYETRRLIEQYAISRICRDDVSIPEEMYKSHEAMKVNLKKGDFYQHIMLDTRFHSSMVEAIGNPVLADVYKSIQERKMRVAYTALSLDPERISIIISQHNDIINALEQKNEDSAHLSLEKHLRPIEHIISKLP